jgi:hypothetical protein
MSWNISVLVLLPSLAILTLDIMPKIELPDS